MSSYDYDLICIGSGPAGQKAAVQAAKLGKRVAVVERQRWVGGVCVDRGTIPSKAFREAVLSFTGYGSRFLKQQGASVGEKVTSRAILDEVGRVVRNESRVIVQQLERNGVDIKRGVASLEDAHTVKIAAESGSESCSAGTLLIATGSRPALYPGRDCNRDIVVTSDDMPFLKKMPRSMVVVGAGVIGMEYASIFATLGIAVTVVNRRPRPLEFLDTAIVEELMRQMEAIHVVFRQEESVQSIETVDGPGGRGIIRLESGDAIESDIVLYSVGRVGATEGLNLENVGLETDSAGRLQVNASFQTAVPHIYAAGDVIGFPSLAATSSEQGRLASRHAFLGDASGMSEYFPIGIYSIPEISMVGSAEHELEAAGIPYETGVARYGETARGQIIGDDSGMLKMLFDRNTRRLLGVHAIGTGATELIHIGQAVLRLRGGLDYFLQTVFNYPTLAECYKIAAWNADNRMPG